jgi:hypothetical protein
MKVLFDESLSPKLVPLLHDRIPELEILYQGTASAVPQTADTRGL